jgi:hypothetical protein
MRQFPPYTPTNAAFPKFAAWLTATRQITQQSFDTAMKSIKDSPFVLKDYLALQTIFSQIAGSAISWQFICVACAATTIVNLSHRFEAAMHFYKLASHFPNIDVVPYLFRQLRKSLEQEEYKPLDLRDFYNGAKSNCPKREFWNAYIAAAKVTHSGLDLFMFLKHSFLQAIKQKFGILPFDTYDTMVILCEFDKIEIVKSLFTQCYITQVVEWLAEQLRLGQINGGRCEYILYYLFGLKKHPYSERAIDGDGEEEEVVIDFPQPKYSRKSIVAIICANPGIIKLFLKNKVPIHGAHAWNYIMTHNWHDAKTIKLVEKLIAANISPLERDENGIHAFGMLQYTQPFAAFPAQYPTQADAEENSDEFNRLSEGSYLLYLAFKNLAASCCLREVCVAALARQDARSPFLLLSKDCICLISEMIKNFEE